MATFNGTQANDLISGTNDDDVITGLGGVDTINGADGNDDINGGAGADDIIGGAGADTIDGGAGADAVDGEEGSDTYAAPDDAGDVIADTGTGEDDVDTLITDLADGDDLVDGAFNLLTGTAGALAAVNISGIEQVQVSNANDFVIDLAGGDQYFAFDQTLTSSDYVATGATDIEGAVFADAGNAITADGSMTFDETAGVVINGTTYAAGDTYTTANGGTVAITFAADEWQFNYTASQQSTIEAGTVVEDEVLSVQMTEADSGNDNIVDVQITLNSNISDNVDLTGETEDFTIQGSDQANTLESGDGNDTIFGGEGADTITLNDGDNRAWAGAGDTGNDTIVAEGDGDNIAAGGAGEDSITAEGNGDNQLWGGADNDELYVDVAAEGSNTLGGGAGDDYIEVDGHGMNQAWGGEDDDEIYLDGDGNNVAGGGNGEDSVYADGDGDNIIFGGADDDYDYIEITGGGDNTVFGGGTGSDDDAGNEIYIDGAGANTIYAGKGDDTVTLDSGATGANTIYAGEGNDFFDFDHVDATGTIIFETGTGADTIEGFRTDGGTVVDLSALGFADADDVLSSMTDDGTDVTLFVTAGQTVTFENVDLVDFQNADPADWLIL